MKRTFHKESKDVEGASGNAEAIRQRATFIKARAQTDAPKSKGGGVEGGVQVVVAGVWEVRR